jgi:pimeloyl-ACP methyl ester carboxylesterase
MSKINILICLVFAFLMPEPSQARGRTSHAWTSETTPIVKLVPCEVSGTRPDKKESVLCGSHEVFEDRARRTGRRISLKIVVFPATGPNKEPDPLFYIPGGPGSSATEDAPYIAANLAAVRQRRDLVFLDQRGTGGSNELFCKFFDPSDLQSYLGHWNPLDQVRKCRTELEAKADLSLYGTELAMDDLDDVRAALGLKKINLYGASYGTRAALTYIRRHGENVRAAWLHGVAPPDQFMPRDFPQHTERALKGVIGECIADTACRTAFPNIETEVRSVLTTLMKGPVEVEVRMPPKREVATRVKLSRDLAAEAIRYMLYHPGPAGRIPLVIHLAATGNFRPLAEAAINYRQQIVATGATGLYVSITCAEDLPWIKPGEGEKNGLNTFLGDYRLRDQREGCALWPRAEVSKEYSSPLRSTVPVLIVTGQWDPVTPPLYGDRTARGFPNSLHVVVPSGGHGLGALTGLECVSNLTSDFIEKGTVKGLNTSCVKDIRREGFLLKFPEPKTGQE